MSPQPLGGRGDAPALSVIVVIYDMEREARRSLYALSSKYQHGVSDEDYEVIVIDNGSPRPFNRGDVSEFGPNFSYHYLHKANQSPARAINVGLRLARSEWVAVMIDGARIVTPGLLRYGLMLPHIYRNPVGLTLGFHIGPDFQCRSLESGYDRATEDRLLESIGWPEDGYRLFEISSAHDPSDGWFRLIGESNCTFAWRRTFEEAGGFDERYVSRGGGLVNLDVQTAIYDRADADLVMILGEGTFHQYHGGATSSVAWSRIWDVLQDFCREYQMIRGRRFDSRSSRRPHYIGHVPAEAMSFLRRFVAVADPELADRDDLIRWLQEEIARRDRTIETLRGELAERARAVERLERHQHTLSMKEAAQ